jgi:osmotically-inducible protein OsmY
VEAKNMSAQAQRLRQREDLEGRVENALMGIEPVRSSDVPLRLDVDAGGGIKLKGWVRSRVIKDMIEDVVLRVPGVASLVLELVVDPELEVRVARALATEPQTAALVPGSVLLRADVGAIRLIGQVPTASARQGVAEVVGQVAGVRRIENALQVG